MMKSHPRAVSALGATLLILSGMVAAAGGQPIVSSEREEGLRVPITPQAAVAGALGEAALPEGIGTDPFRVSDMGPDGDVAFAGLRAAVAYNSTDAEFLVVWEGDDDTGALVAGEFEIFGQRVDAFTGAEVGENDFRISVMGTDGDAAFDATRPEVAYNPTANEYLVVWYGDNDGTVLVDDELEIWGRRVASDGTLLGDQIRISDMGPDGIQGFDALDPFVAHNSLTNEYLVVWWGCDDGCAVTDQEAQIFGQRLTGAGAETGDNDFLISDAGHMPAFGPTAAYNDINDEYLVTWWGCGAGPCDDFPDVAATEVFGQLLDATGGGIGSNFRVSDMGSDDDDLELDALRPDVSFSPTDNEYLVVWYGDDDTAPLSNGEAEVFGQRIDAITGDEVGDNDFRLSENGPDGVGAFDAVRVSVTHNPERNHFFLAWQGDEEVDNEIEIFARRQFFGDNTAPVVTIDMPLDGDEFDTSVVIDFAGDAFDAEDGDLTAILDWTSNLDGSIGTGAAFSTSLSPGPHTVTAAVSDSLGVEGQDQIALTITSPTCPADAVVDAPVSDTQEIQVVNDITVTSTAEVTATGDLTLRAGGMIVFENGFSVADGGRLAASAIEDPCV